MTSSLPKPSIVTRLQGRGFTLVELMVTLAVAAILTVVAVPATQRLLAARATASQADELAESLRLARSEALRRGGVVSVCASSNVNAASPQCAAQWLDGWVVFTDFNHDGVIDANEPIVKVASPQGALASLVEAGGLPAVSFQANGLAVGAARFVASPKGVSEADGDFLSLQRIVTLSAQGRVKVSKGSE
jgi:type IV fimbrial biogenesis protein FimT